MSALLATLVLSVAAQQSAAPAVPLKKLRILHSDAHRLDETYRYMGLPKTLTDPELLKLKGYVDEKADLARKADPEIILSTLAWVSRQWKHDGNNPADGLTSYEILQNAAKGTQYRCVEYGKVSADVLKAYGYVSRQLFIQSPDVAYGGYGRGHVVSEVWSNKLNKWVYIDPQFGLYAKFGERYLSFFDIYDLRRRHKFDAIQFLYAQDPGTGEAQKAKDIKAYKAFLSRYFGQMLVDYTADSANGQICLLLDKKDRSVTFQSHDSPGIVFANSPEDLYFEPNHSSMVVWFQSSARPDVPGWANWDEPTFLRRMGEVAVRPNLHLTLQHNMPWFDHFEIKIGDKPFERVENPRACLVNLPEGKTSVTVVAVNQAGVRGVPCVTEFSYGR